MSEIDLEELERRLRENPWLTAGRSTTLAVIARVRELELSLRDRNEIHAQNILYEKRIAKLEAALRPFALAAERLSARDRCAFAEVSTDDLLEARAALVGAK